MRPMQVDDRVIVYHDPITRTKAEGVATVLRAFGHERYEVAFDNDEDAGRYERIIHTPWDVCAWCRCFTQPDGTLIRRCLPEEYEVTQSHGICLDCKRRELLAAAAQRQRVIDGRN